MCFFFIAVHTVGKERREDRYAAEREREREIKEYNSLVQQVIMI